MTPTRKLTIAVNADEKAKTVEVLFVFPEKTFDFTGTLASLRDLVATGMGFMADFLNPGQMQDLRVDMRRILLQVEAAFDAPTEGG